MRDIQNTLTDKEYKYIINSILSAVDFTKVDPNTKKSFISKINGQGQQQAQPGQAQPAQAPAAPQESTGGLSEDGEGNVETGADGDTSQQNVHSQLINSSIVQEVLKMAGLDGNNDPETLSIDVAEAMFVYAMDYNEDTPFIHYIQGLLQTIYFKARPSLQGYNSLDPEGKEIYLALVNYGEEHTTGGAINEEIKTIYSRIIKDVRKKLHKI